MSSPFPAVTDAAPGGGADDTRFVLMHTSHAGNVGAAARAMKVMGFNDLVLVQPRFADVLCREEAIAMASGAADVLARARIVASLSEALDGIHHACATAMTARDFGPPTQSPRVHFDALVGSARRVALVFGSERYGMSNEDVYRCHVCLRIATDARYGSLNLAQAVQIMAYEWRLALGGFEGAARSSDATLADGVAVQGVLAHWQAALEEVGYLDPKAPKKLMPRLQQLLNRAQLTHDEVQILRGIARAMQQRR